MRVGIFSDSHGNLVALDAVLTDLERARPDSLVCLGDVAALGPQPGQTIARVQALGCPVVSGNTDAWLIDPPAAEVPPEDDRSRRVAEIETWCAAELAAADRAYLATFQSTVRVPLGDDLSLLCYHGSPQSNTDHILPTTPDADLDRMLAGFPAPLLAGGHTHLAMLRRHQGRVVLNPGSVSLPVARLPLARPSPRPPWAEYAVVGWQDGRLSVEFRGVPLDLAAVERAARASAMPHAEWWIDGWR